jgi:radical SAM protein with 4Fe4S-binding SPASM domain
MKDIQTGSFADYSHVQIKKDFVRLTGRGNLALYDNDLLKAKLITKKTFQHKMNQQQVLRTISYNKCFSSKIYIDCELNVYPCVMERRICHGSIAEDLSIQDVLQNEIISLNKDKVEGCSDCEYRYACYDCRPDSISDDIKTNPWYCSYDPYNGEWQDINEFINKLQRR